MGLSAFEKLPNEIHHIVLGSLSEESPSSVCALALASRDCHSAASPFLYRDLTVKANERGSYQQLIERHTASPLFNLRMHYVRTLRFQASVRESYEQEKLRHSRDLTNIDRTGEEQEYAAKDDNDRAAKCAEEDPKATSTHRPSFAMPDGRRWYVDKPIHKHGYASMNILAPCTPLDFGPRSMSRILMNEELLVPDVGQFLTAQRLLVHFIVTSKDLRLCIWECDVLPDMTVFDALQTFHPSVALSLEMHHSRSSWNGHQGPASRVEFEIFRSQLVREISSYCLEFDHRQDPSTSAIIRLLRASPNLRSLRCHIVLDGDMLYSSSPQHQLDAEGPEMKMSLLDNGPAKLDRLVFTETVLPWSSSSVDAFRAFKSSIDTQCLKTLDLGDNTGPEILRVFTGVNLLPSLRSLGLSGSASEVVLSDYVPVFKKFIESLPPLQQIKIRRRLDADCVWLAIEHSSQNLRILECKSTLRMWDLNAVKRLVFHCPALQRLFIPVHPDSFEGLVELAETIAELSALRFCEIKCYGKILPEERIWQIWNAMFDANTKLTGNPSLLGIKITHGSRNSSIVLRSERDDAGPKDVWIVRCEK